MLATPSGLVADPIVTIEGAHILELSTRSASDVVHVDHDFEDATITAGFLDIHFHGIAGQDVMHASPEGFREIASNLGGKRKKVKKKKKKRKKKIKKKK